MMCTTCTLSPYDGPVRETHHECQSDVEACDTVYESHSTGTFKACASFAMVEMRIVLGEILRRVDAMAVRIFQEQRLASHSIE